MLNRKKLIPSLGAAMLTLTGITCGKNTSISPKAALEDGLDAFCMKLVECYPGDYDNADQCIKYFMEDYGAGSPGPPNSQVLTGIAKVVSEYLLEDASVPPECIRALGSYFECIGDLTCEVYSDDDLFFKYCDYEDEFTQLCGDFLDP